VVCTIGTPGNRLRRTTLPPVVLSLIAKIEITDHGDWAADLAEGCDPNDTVAGICPSRFRKCLRKSVPAVHPLRRRGTSVVAARGYVTSLRTADSVLATDRSSVLRSSLDNSIIGQTTGGIKISNIFG